MGFVVAFFGLVLTKERGEALPVIHSREHVGWHRALGPGNPWLIAGHRCSHRIMITCTNLPRPVALRSTVSYLHTVSS